MTPFVPTKRNVLLWPSPSAYSKEDILHLHVVLTDVFEVEGGLPSVILVSLSGETDEFEFDKTCLLETGCHPNITKPSYVFYAKIRVESVLQMRQLLKVSAIFQRPDVSDELFAKIAAGVAESPFANERNKKLYQKHR